MDNIQTVMVGDKIFGEIEYVVIDNGDGSFTSMSKEYYDEQQAALEAQIESNAK